MSTDAGGRHRDHAEALRAAISGDNGVTETSLRIATSARAAGGAPADEPYDTLARQIGEASYRVTDAEVIGELKDLAEWTVGILYGYTGEYKHKVPLNVGGFSPGAVAGVGWRFTKTLAGQLNILGTSGLMFQLSVDLP